MSDRDGTLTKWTEVASLLAQGWHVENACELVSPSGERVRAWTNAVNSCRKRGLVKLQSAAKPEGSDRS